MPGDAALPERGLAESGDDPPRNCVFLGCDQRGVLTTEVRCRQCGRETSPRIVATLAMSEAAAEHERAALPVPPPSSANVRDLRLAAEAGNVAVIFEVLSWLVVAVGALSVVAGLVTWGAEEQPLVGFLSAGLVAFSTAVSWGFMRLGALVARYVQHRVG